MKTFKLILSLIAIGVWILVLQNTGIIPITHRVRVINEIDANITNAVDANVSGSVNVNNTVDVNIHAINGYNQVTTGTGSIYPYGNTECVPVPVVTWL